MAPSGMVGRVIHAAWLRVSRYDPHNNDRSHWPIKPPPPDLLRLAREQINVGAETCRFVVFPIITAGPVYLLGLAGAPRFRVNYYVCVCLLPRRVEILFTLERKNGLLCLFGLTRRLSGGKSWT